jgi:hypothetical protein
MNALPKNTLKRAYALLLGMLALTGITASAMDTNNNNNNNIRIPKATASVPTMETNNNNNNNNIRIPKATASVPTMETNNNNNNNNIRHTKRTAPVPTPVNAESTNVASDITAITFNQYVVNRNKGIITRNVQRIPIEQVVFANDAEIAIPKNFLFSEPIRPITYAIDENFTRGAIGLGIATCAYGVTPYVYQAGSQAVRATSSLLTDNIVSPIGNALTATGHVIANADTLLLQGLTATEKTIASAITTAGTFAAKLVFNGATYCLTFAKKIALKYPYTTAGLLLFGILNEMGKRERLHAHDTQHTQQTHIQEQTEIIKRLIAESRK